MSELVSENSEILKTKCPEWDFNNPATDAHALVEEMLQKMRQENGMGLAANQIGLLHRVFVMEYQGRVWACFNPEIVESSTELVTGEEGCLSFPGLYLKVKRPKEIAVKYYDPNGILQEEHLTGLVARCYSHEREHLDGSCFTDRVSKLTLAMAKKRREKNGRKS